MEAIDRRVLGVLVEKAKTTPEAYPLSLNALRTGCNQKSNRYPLMDVEPEDIEESLSRLRELGAVAEVQGGGRVPRFRHYLYDWLGVDKAELAVMAELLLRGAQTEGELRGRAARMEPLPDLDALRPILASLQQKRLVVSLSPAGRGHVVTHALYQPREMEKLQLQFDGQAPRRRQAPPPTSRPHKPVPPPCSPPQHRRLLPRRLPQRPSRRKPATTSKTSTPCAASWQTSGPMSPACASDLDDLWSQLR